MCARAACSYVMNMFMLQRHAVFKVPRRDAAGALQCLPWKRGQLLIDYLFTVFSNSRFSHCKSAVEFFWTILLKLLKMVLLQPEPKAQFTLICSVTLISFTFIRFSRTHMLSY